MRIVGLRAAELIVGDDGTRTRGRRTAAQILEPPAASVIANEDVQLAVGAELDDAAVVIAAKRLAGVGLKGMQFDEVRARRQFRAVPFKPITRLPRSGTSARLAESAPVLLSVQ